MVLRWSAGSWLEDQDMWRMSGIFRSVWLLNKPKQHLSDVQISPQLDALYRDGELQVNLAIAAADAQLAGLVAEVSLWDGEQLVARQRQRPGSAPVDERGHYAERATLVLAVEKTAAMERGNAPTAIVPWLPCGTAKSWLKLKPGTSAFAG
ncbi:Beta-galactosidase [Raoultella planticola]|uniref:beta-galactosidase n=1 Tax=Raoultella planticola TaxID=575 RepID=A0A485AFK5_RAOPL|nr:Beta-galactosidase [Raoultella planticola]